MQQEIDPEQLALLANALCSGTVRSVDQAPAQQQLLAVIFNTITLAGRSHLCLLSGYLALASCDAICVFEHSTSLLHRCLFIWSACSSAFAGIKSVRIMPDFALVLSHTRCWHGVQGLDVGQ